MPNPREIREGLKTCDQLPTRTPVRHPCLFVGIMSAPLKSVSYWLILLCRSVIESIVKAADANKEKHFFMTVKAWTYLNNGMNICTGLDKVSNLQEMDSAPIFQLTASILASICCGGSLAFWLLSIKAMSLRRLSKEPLISGQALIGGFAFLGSIASILLVFLIANPNPEEGRLLTSLSSISSLIRFQIHFGRYYSWKLAVCFFYSF